MDAIPWSCPECRGSLGPEFDCPACGLKPAYHHGIPDFAAGQPASEPEVNAFYEARPFPGYAEDDDASSILLRSQQSSYLQALDAAIPPRACVLDAGCGTGQIAAFLSLKARRRQVVGADACLASLIEAARFRDRAGLDGLTLLRGDLFQLPLREAAFDVVHCRGVVHHTADPQRAVHSVARHVKPGGFLVLGFYESIARLPHRLRRQLARLAGMPLRALDPILKRRDLDEEKKRTWIEDQYRHPLEWSLAFPEIVATLEDRGFRWLRSLPPAIGGDDLFRPTPKPSAISLLGRRIGWASSLGSEDAGLVCYVARRESGR